MCREEKTPVLNASQVGNRMRFIFAKSNGKSNQQALCARFYSVLSRFRPAATAKSKAAVANPQANQSVSVRAIISTICPPLHDPNAIPVLNTPT